MSVVLLLLLTLVQAPDEFPTLIRQLGSDSIVDRDEATRRLISLGEPALERLGKAREATVNPEVKSRIQNVITGIQRAAALAKVFGPARRLTIAARKQPLKEILQKFAIPGLTLRAGALDEEARVDFQIRDLPWWEALDRLGRATRARYELGYEGEGFTAEFHKGPAREFPVVYLEQFRISVVETQRLEVRTPAGVTSIGLAIVEVRHQPDLRPAQLSEAGVRITSIKDAGGKDARTEEIPGSTMVDQRFPLAESAVVWIRADAAMPLTLIGSASLRFSGGTKDLSLDLTGDGSKARVGNFEVRVTQFNPSRSSSILRIRAESKTAAKTEDRLERGSLRLVDSKGGRHPGEVRWTRSGEDYAEWECEFTSGVEGPVRVTFRWIADFHDVEIPILLEGVRLPDAR